MKTSLLMASAAAIRLHESPDCPESTQVFPLNERSSPVSAGLVQTGFVSGLSQEESMGNYGGVRFEDGTERVFVKGNGDFADGINDDKGEHKWGEKMTVKGDGVEYAQKANKFADGLSDSEHKWGENITVKGDGVRYVQTRTGFADGLNDSEHKWGENITVKGDGVRYAQNGVRFADGLTDAEHKWGETYTVKGDTVQFPEKKFADGLSDAEHKWGEKYTVKGDKVEYAQISGNPNTTPPANTGSPKCNGSNGIPGTDCVQEARY